MRAKPKKDGSMNRKILFTVFLVFTSILFSVNAANKNFIIYSIVQDLPMGEPDEVVKKNYYINIGQKQGVENGTVLKVLRQISRQDPYEGKNRYEYNVPIGKLKVIHAESGSAIAIMEKMNTGLESPLYEIDNFMIGDKVSVDVE